MPVQQQPAKRKVHFDRTIRGEAVGDVGPRFEYCDYRRREDMMVAYRPHEGNLAWELVEQVRDSLNEDERHVVFIHLGVGDYPPVFHCVLTAIARERLPLSPQTVEHIMAWADAYDRHREFSTLLDRALGGSAAMDETG